MRPTTETGLDVESVIPPVEKRDKSLDLSQLPSSQHEETRRLYNELVESHSPQISGENFEQRVQDAATLLSELSDLEALDEEGRSEFAANVRLSLDNFVTEEIIEHGANVAELKELIAKEYQNVKDNHEVSINANWRGLGGVCKSGRIKRYEEIAARSNRREGKGLFGTKPSRYGEIRKERDAALGYGDEPFVVGALATKNGYDEIIGPAPFYGHGTLALDNERLAERVRFMEGDSMTGSEVVGEVVPRWLHREWDNIGSRKLDWSGALLSKALMEASLKQRGYTYMHTMYVEAHILDDVTLDDVREVRYGVVQSQEEKITLKNRRMYQKRTHPEKGDEDRIEGCDISLRMIEEKNEKRDDFLARADKYLKDNTGNRLEITKKNLDREIHPTEEKFRPNNFVLALTADQFF
ncbi:MAG: hypothetical protein HQ530_04270 [Parcubacteria group bacterium]|nr:hypothetical protein [Parcubacteria group bacterium]